MNRPLSFAPETFETERTSLSLFALSRVIPDDPDYRKYVPLNYRLNAKEIVGEVEIRFWTELVHKGAEVVYWGLVGAELAWETSILGGGARDWSFRRSGGLVSGGSGKDRGRLVRHRILARRGDGCRAPPQNWSKAYFGSEYVPAFPAFPRGRDIAIGNYSVAL